MSTLIWPGSNTVYRAGTGESAGPVELQFAGDTYIYLPVIYDYSGPQRMTMTAVADNSTGDKVLWAHVNEADYLLFVAGAGAQSITLRFDPTAFTNSGAYVPTQREQWGCRCDNNGGDNVLRHGTSAGSSVLGTTPPAIGMNIGIAADGTSNGFVGVIRDIRMWSDQPGNTLIHRWLVTDGCPDGGTIIDSVGSAHGTLHLGSGEWIADVNVGLDPDLATVTATNKVGVEYTTGPDENVPIASNWSVKVNGGAAVYAISGTASYSSTNVTLTFPDNTFASGNTVTISYMGSDITHNGTKANTFSDFSVGNPL